MSLTDEQRYQINRLITYRDQLTNNLFHIEQIIKQYFPEEFDIAYQHWIPQVSTALFDDKRWLPRGEQTMEDTIQRLIEKAKEKSK
jgi:hypothetical protein